MPSSEVLSEVQARLTYRVDRGIKLLLDRYSGYSWVGEINPDELVMDNALRCLLGQLFGDFYLGMKHLGLAMADAKAFGFDADTRLYIEIDVGLDIQYSMLEVIWTNKLRELA